MINQKRIVKLLCIIATVLVIPTAKPVLASYDKEYVSYEDSLEKNLKPFNKYGLYYNRAEDIVYYNNEPVKAFVDLRESDSNGYWFNIGYHDRNKIDSKLYLISVHDNSGQIIGIEKMPRTIIEDLYEEDFTDESDIIIEDLDDYKDNKNESQNIYYTFDATTILKAGNEASDIVVTDKFNKSDIPDFINQLALDYFNTQKAGYIISEQNQQLDGWFIYGGEYRFKWNVETEGNTLKLYLTDDNSLKGSTLIHYKAPKTYKKLEVYVNNKKL